MGHGEITYYSLRLELMNKGYRGEKIIKNFEDTSRRGSLKRYKKYGEKLRRGENENY